MNSDICPFCERHPYEYVDVGIGCVPCAVTCCQLGDAFFRGQRPDPETVTMTYEDFVAIGMRLPSWRDIDDAPHDGSDILTWDGNDQAVLFWSEYGNGWTSGDPKVKYNPTHWMPLPTRPDYQHT